MTDLWPNDKFTFTFLNTLLTIPQVFGSLTLTLTSSDARGAFAPKNPWDNIAKNLNHR